MSEYYRRTPNTKCAVCKKAIYRRPSQLKGSQGRAYCSSSCYGRSCRKEVPCVVCETMMLASFHKKTCSRACSNIHRTGIQYKRNRPKDKVKATRALKVRLLKERGLKCERCGYDKYEILHVHHKDRNRENNNLDNLALICPNCHYEEHYLEKSWLKNLEF